MTTLEWHSPKEVPQSNSPILVAYRYKKGSSMMATFPADHIWFNTSPYYLTQSEEVDFLPICWAYFDKQPLAPFIALADKHEQQTVEEERQHRIKQLEEELNKLKSQ